ncbi:hypothetical protein MASR2M78_31640 [Treponema sp.]
MLTREEDILYSPKRPSVLIYHRSALGAKGELLAMESRSVLDVGAAGPFAEETLDRLCLGSLGAYRCPNIRIEGFAVKTNTPPSGPFAGLGLSQAFLPWNAMPRVLPILASLTQPIGAKNMPWDATICWLLVLP